MLLSIALIRIPLIQFVIPSAIESHSIYAPLPSSGGDQGRQQRHKGDPDECDTAAGDQLFHALGLRAG
jgi:hypothetical protein